MARKSVMVLPTLFTLSNLLCGFASIFCATRQADSLPPWGWSPLTYSALFIFLGMLMDGLDGRIARLTRTMTDLGEQLDSMADMVTFGLAPAFIAMEVARIVSPFASGMWDRYFARAALAVACIYVACAALRLARFNIEAASESYPDHNSFNGLPSPGAAGTVASLVLLHEHFLAHYPSNYWPVTAAAVGMIAVTLLVALAMVSTFRYIHVMNRYIRGQAPFRTIVKSVIAALAVLIYPQGALAAGFVIYALSAPSIWLWSLMAKPTPPEA